eukprot:454383-Rhodomonas_salina.5
MKHTCAPFASSVPRIAQHDADYTPARYRVSHSTMRTIRQRSTAYRTARCGQGQSQASTTQNTLGLYRSTTQPY